MTQDRADNGMFWSTFSLFCSGVYASIAWLGSVLHGVTAFMAATGALLGGIAAIGQFLLKLHEQGWFDHIRTTLGRKLGHRRPRASPSQAHRTARPSARR